METTKKTTVQRLLSGALMLLGFSSCGETSGDYPVEYGSPHVKFEVKGRVTSNTNQPLKGIQVITTRRHAKYDADTVYTNPNGEFESNELEAFTLDENLTVYFNDVDGEANGGSFLSDSVKVMDLEDKKKVEDRKGWYGGKFIFSGKEAIKLSPAPKEAEE